LPTCVPKQSLGTRELAPNSLNQMNDS
jgi:hypothetical protein